eukprot:scaffold15437_cov71-Phaeocystis_antarctica.AAC.4
MDDGHGGASFFSLVGAARALRDAARGPVREACGGALDGALLVLGALPLLVPRVGLAVDVRDVAPLHEVARLAPEGRPSGGGSSWQLARDSASWSAEQVPGWWIAAEALGGPATSRGLLEGDSA